MLHALTILETISNQWLESAMAAAIETLADLKRAECLSRQPERFDGPTQHCNKFTLIFQYITLAHLSPPKVGIPRASRRPREMPARPPPTA